jgi:hypothetical protein
LNDCETARWFGDDPGRNRWQRAWLLEWLTLVVSCIGHVRPCQLNQALRLIVLTRLRYDPATRAYAERRRAQGKTNREIRRCLVRYVARQLYRLLEAGRPAGQPGARCGRGAP